MRAAQAGDALALETVMMHYRPLVISAVRHYYCEGLEFDDLIAYGLRGMWEGIMAWRPGRGTQLIGFLLCCIRRELWSAIAAARTHNQRINNTAVKLNDLRGAMLFTHEHTPERAVLLSESRRFAEAKLQRFRAELTDLERICVEEVMLRGRLYIDVARELGRPVKSIDNAVKRAKEKWVALYGRPGKDKTTSRKRIYRRMGDWYDD